MNNEQNIFEGIPSLGDDQGLENYIAQQNQPAAQNQIPAMLQQNQPAGTNTPETNPGNTGVPGYTTEQIDAIIRQNQELMARVTQPAKTPAVNPAVRPQNNIPNTQGAYSPQVRAQIVELVNRGVPLETILSALNGNRQNNETMQRITAVEQYLQQQEYVQQQNAFIDKMTAFGDKFGLSEDELVTFANTALSKGINVAQVTDVEAVFRAVYPQQYAIRAQRLQGVASPQIYGGVSVQETPRAATSKAEDAYVEDFLKGAMPNQYRQK
jgi:hypothetical protein